MRSFLSNAVAAVAATKTTIAATGALVLLVAATAVVHLRRRRRQATRTRQQALYWTWDDGEQEQRRRIDCSDEQLRFPPEFVWGTATASYQIEGNAPPSNWTEWEALPREKWPKKKDKPPTANPCGAACDHWNRVEEDVGLMTELGVNAYRFGIDWSRLEPKENEWDAAAVAHYHNEIDLLKSSGIEPWVTLFHFVQPLWFDQKGGFEKEENIALFVRFCTRVAQEFGPKVKHWCTINEPSVFASMGYVVTIFPPGKEDWLMAGTVLKNLLEAHVQVYKAIKALPDCRDSKVGIVHSIFLFEPYSPGSLIHQWIANVLDDGFNECALRFFRTGEFHFQLLHVSVKHSNPEAMRSNDYCGVNFYSHFFVKPQLSLTDPFKMCPSRCIENCLMTDMDYEVYPEGLYRAVKRVSSLGLPIYVTENGLADELDDKRALFIRRYLYALSKAIQEGCDVRGYFYWSLMDNFEWAEGYRMRFGLYHVDFATQKRTLREGAKVFQRIVKQHRDGKTTHLNSN